MLPDHLKQWLDRASSSLRRADRTSFSTQTQNALAHVTNAIGFVEVNPEIDAARGRAELMISRFRGEWECLGFRAPGSTVEDARKAALAAVDNLARALEGAALSPLAKTLGYGSPFQD